MTKQTPVRRAFDAACAFRAKVPLPKGRFKLEQALWELGRIRSNIDNVAKIVRKRDAREAKAALVGIAPEERGLYVKQVPAHVANILGRLIFPGIAELEADGVAPQRVTMLVAQSKSHAAAILDEADYVHDRLRAGVRVEYHAMKTGGSFLLPLIDDAEALVSVALDACSFKQA
jgi:hypothetical protein